MYIFSSHKHTLESNINHIHTSTHTKANKHWNKFRKQMFKQIGWKFIGDKKKIINHSS